MSQIDDFLNDTPSQPNSGGSRSDIDSFLSDAPKRKRSLLETANDLVIEGANAAAGGLTAAANFVAPGNRVSEFIEDKFIKAGEEKQSDVVRGAKRELSEGIEQADGVMGELGAVGKYIAQNPLLATSQALGSFALPGAAVKGAGALATGLGAGARGATLAGQAGGVAAGTAMAGGDAAGTAYELSKNAGATEEQAQAAARQASIIPAAVGGITGAFGAERILAGGRGFSGGMVSRGLKTGLSEAAQEALEEGVTQFEGQRAAMPFDETIDPTKGVAAAAGLGAALGFIPGAAIGAMSAAGDQPARQPLVNVAGLQREPVQEVPEMAPVKPSEAMGLDPAAGPLSAAAAQAVDAGASAVVQPVPAQPMAPQPAAPLAAAVRQADAQPAPDLAARTTEELRAALRNAQDPNIRKAVAAELSKRKREEAAAMPDPLQTSERGFEFSAVDESFDGAAVNAKLFRDLSDASAIKKQWLDVVNPELDLAVQRNMLRIAQNPEILNAVVELIPVNVVDMLRRRQLTPEMVFNNPSVLKSSLIRGNSNDSIAIPVDGAAAIMRAVAMVAAKNKAVDQIAHSGGLSVNGNAAANTGVPTAITPEFVDNGGQTGAPLFGDSTSKVGSAGGVAKDVRGANDLGFVSRNDGSALMAIGGNQNRSPSIASILNQAQQKSQKEPQEPAASQTRKGQPLTDTGTNMLGRGADPLQSIIQGENDARRVAEGLRGDDGTGAGAGVDNADASVAPDMGAVRGRGTDTADAQPAAQGDAGQRPAGTADSASSLRPDGWRKNALKAGRVARGLGLNPKGKRLAEIVAEIDAVDAGTDVQNAPQGTAGEAQATAVEAPEAARGDDAAAAGVPAEAGAGAAQANGLGRDQPPVEVTTSGMAERRAKLTGKDRWPDPIALQGDAKEDTEAKRKVVDYMNGDISRTELMNHLEQSGLPYGKIASFTQRIGNDGPSIGEIDAMMARRESAAQSQPKTETQPKPSNDAGSVSQRPQEPQDAVQEQGKEAAEAVSAEVAQPEQDAAPAQQEAQQPTQAEQKGEWEAQFSIADSNERDLIVTHNLTAENLLHAVKMGGLPVPSLAVTKKDSPLDGFGEITLIGKKEMADPKGYAKTQVFGADIYSPRYPTVQYKAAAKALNELDSKLKSARDLVGGRLLAYGEIDRNGPKELERDPSVAAAFLQSKDIDVPVVRKAMPKPLQDALMPFVDDARDSYELAKAPDFVEASIAAHREILEQAYGDAPDAKAEIEREIAQVRENIATRGTSQLARSYASEVSQHRKAIRDGGQIDPYATQQAIDQVVRDAGLVKELRAYAKDLFDGLNAEEKIFRGFTASGNRKYVPHTLDNVVKILKEELRGGENFNYGVGSVRAKLTPKFTSVDAIRKAKGRLVTKEQFDAIKDEVNKELIDLSERLTYKQGGGTISTDMMGDVIVDAAKYGVRRAADGLGVEVSDDAAQDVAEFMQKLRNLPTAYFEAKIMRPVALAEFAAAVVPKDTDQKVIDALRREGITRILAYDKAENRAGAVQAMSESLGDEAMFSIAEETASAYADRIDALFAGEPASRIGVKAMDSSDVMTMLGYESKPVLLAESKVIQGMENHPEMTAEVWKKVPEWLDNPAAVFDSDTDGGLVVIAPEMVAGKAVSIIVRPDGERRNALNVHLLLNAYTRSISTPYQRWISQGLLRYADQKKFPALFEAVAGRQLPGTALQNKPGTKRILTEKNLAGYRKNAGGLPLFKMADQQVAKNLSEQHNAPSGMHAQAVKAFADRLNKQRARPVEMEAVSPGTGERGKMAKTIQGVARKLFNRDVVFVRFTNGDPLFNGAVSQAAPGKVFINIDSQRPMMAVLGHELLHELRKSDEGAYQALRTRLDALLADKSHPIYANILAVKYEKAGMKSLPRDIAEELYADIVGDHFTEPQFWQALTETSKEKPLVWKRLLNAVARWLESIGKKLGRIKSTNDGDVMLTVAQQADGKRPFGTGAFLTDVEASRQAVLDAIKGFDGRQAKGADALSVSNDADFSIADARDNLAQVMPQKVMDLYADATTSQRGFNRWWHRTVGTQLHKAKINKEFGRVFYSVQDFMRDVSRMATIAADKAPTLLTQIESLSDVGKAVPLLTNPARMKERKANLKAASDALFDGTLKFTRDANGKPVEAMDAQDAGIVWTNAELKERGLSPGAIKMYREGRAAIDQSLENMLAADIYRVITTMDPEMLVKSPSEWERFADRVRKMAASEKPMDAVDATIEAMRERAEELENEVNTLRNMADQAEGDEALFLNAAATEPQTKLDGLREEIKKVSDKRSRINALKKAGYAPLMRFGEYAVSAYDEAGQRVFFGLYESQFAANRAARKFNEQGLRTDKSVMSKQEFEQLKGLSPETAMLFAEMLGVEKNEAMQTWLKNAVAEQSALKRHIRRKGVSGFDDDSSRVVAAFLTSNSRAASRALHSYRIEEAVANVRQGDVKDEAIKLADYVNNPKEEAQAIRTLLFVNYIGGSVSSALVNLTQTFVQTYPFLSQYGGAVKAGQRVSSAMRMAMSKNIANKEIAEAVKQAENDGVIKPQEVFQLQAEASRTMGSNLYARTGLALWGSFFQLAEVYNRRVAFIAAYQTAKQEGIRNPFAFAENAVNETQGVFNKGNRPNWSRGAIGATLFTFKTFTIQYVEFLKRMPPKQRAVALGVLFLMAGAGGFPFAEDAEDLIDTVAQGLGYNFTTKSARDEFLRSTLGDGWATFIQSGVSPWTPFDVSQRLGMADLLPGTGILKKSETRKEDQALEIFGVAGSFVRDALKGEVRPIAFRNAAKAIEMYDMGVYRDTRGRKVMDVEPLDAILKSIGLQPAGVAAESRKIGMQYEKRALYEKVRNEITEQMALGHYESDPQKVERARQAAMQWNEKNPEAPMFINMQNVWRRVREMNLDRTDRFLKSAPKELRGQIQQAIQ